MTAINSAIEIDPPGRSRDPSATGSIPGSAARWTSCGAGDEPRRQADHRCSPATARAACRESCPHWRPGGSRHDAGPRAGGWSRRTAGGRSGTARRWPPRGALADLDRPPRLPRTAHRAGSRGAEAVGAMPRHFSARLGQAPCADPAAWTLAPAILAPAHSQPPPALRHRGDAWRADAGSRNTGARSLAAGLRVRPSRLMNARCFCRPRSKRSTQCRVGLRTARGPQGPPRGPGAESRAT